jgi:hypothetical protein
MKTKSFFRELLCAVAPGFFILLLPTCLAGVFLPPPYNVIAWAIILAIGGIIFRFRDQIDARRAAWRLNRATAGRMHRHRAFR